MMSWGSVSAYTVCYAVGPLDNVKAALLLMEVVEFAVNSIQMVAVALLYGQVLVEMENVADDTLNYIKIKSFKQKGYGR